MSYFVTGGTGFIGRHLIERLLERAGSIHVLVRESSQGRLEELIEDWGPVGAQRVVAVIGDLTQPRLGLSDERVQELRGQIDHFFHLAASYDMTADDRTNQRINVGGTRHAVELANQIEAGCFQHVSSIAAAGMHRGLFREDMFDQGQRLDHPYHRTKFESEKLAREKTEVPWRVYRPGVVVGSSQTGEMDKIDGPYYFFSAIKRLADHVPDWVPLAGPELGCTNIVPVDFVAAALDHIAHEPGLDGRAFHLTNPRSQRSADVLNTFARAADAPRVALRVNLKPLSVLPRGPLSMLMKLPPARGVRRSVLAELGIPEGVLGYVGLTARFDTRNADRALAGSGIEVPRLEDYADRLWDYWQRHLDPDLFGERASQDALNGQAVLITGASSGIGQAAARRIAAAGGIPLLVARSADKLAETKREIEQAGGTAYTYSADLADLDSIDRLVEQVLAEHAAVNVLVNNAGRSIRRGIALSLERFHDFERTMQLNYFGAIKLTMGLLPHMRERGGGHVVNVSSIGVQTNPPRFSAYVASKAALDAWTRCVASEVVGDGVTFTTIHMPLVRTPMIAPTKMYDAFPTISSEEAGEMICQAIRKRPKRINTRLGTLGEVSYALAPKLVDQVLHLAYRVFPDSAAAKGQKDPQEKASIEQRAMANLTKGVHW